MVRRVLRLLLAALLLLGVNSTSPPAFATGISGAGISFGEAWSETRVYAGGFEPRVAIPGLRELSKRDHDWDHEWNRDWAHEWFDKEWDDDGDALEWWPHDWDRGRVRDWVRRWWEHDRDHGWDREWFHKWLHAWKDRRGWDWKSDPQPPSSVPEPTTALLLAGGLLGLAAAGRRR